MHQATKESFARSLEGLVRKYEADRDTYRSSQYNEAQTRTQFITPLLEALGWDVRNEAGVPYNLCEVLEEKGETHGRAGLHVSHQRPDEILPRSKVPIRGSPRGRHSPDQTLRVEFSKTRRIFRGRLRLRAVPLFRCLTSSESKKPSRR